MAASRKEAARRYVQLDLARHYTGLPDEQRQDIAAAQRKLVREHGDDLPTLAAVGTARDFDERLEPGEREHQRYMQRQRRLDPQGVANKRAEIRSREHGPAPKAPPAAARRSGVKAAARGGRNYARARRQLLASSGVQAGGSVLLQALGVAVGLTLLYLVLSPRGSKAFSALTTAASGFLRALVGPVDPLNPGKAASPTSGVTGSTAAGTYPLQGVSGAVAPPTANLKITHPTGHVLA